jgi:hypothetical protein
MNTFSSQGDKFRIPSTNLLSYNNSTALKQVKLTNWQARYKQGIFLIKQRKYYKLLQKPLNTSLQISSGLRFSKQTSTPKSISSQIQEKKPSDLKSTSKLKDLWTESNSNISLSLSLNGEPISILPSTPSNQRLSRIKPFKSFEIPEISSIPDITLHHRTKKKRS